MSKHDRQEDDCLNCKAKLYGPYCHSCGQKNLQIKESFGHMMNHAISDYFHFDHQFFHTLKPLIFKPGFLTNEYLAGRRAQYLHPVKMYIFISVVFFLFFFKTGGSIIKINQTTNDPVTVNKSLNATKKQIQANPYIPNAAKKEIAKDIDKSKVSKKSQHVTVIDTDDAKGPNTWFHPNTKDTSYAEYLANQAKLPANKQDDYLTKIWNRKTFDYTAKYGSGARETFIEELQHNTPKMMFLLLPLFALILRFSFWKNKKFYVEHLIYALHFHCFLFLFLGIIIPLQVIIPSGWAVIFGLINAIATCYVLWYIYRSLRVVYQRNAFHTIIKMITMYFMYFVAFAFCVTVLFFVTTVI